MSEGGAPPGFNPDASALGGGTIPDIPIARMTGGGLDSTYTGGDMLVAPSHIPIARMTGGGGPEDIEAAQKEVDKYTTLIKETGVEIEAATKAVALAEIKYQAADAAATAAKAAVTSAKAAAKAPAAAATATAAATAAAATAPVKTAANAVATAKLEKAAKTTATDAAELLIKFNDAQNALELLNTKLADEERLLTSAEKALKKVKKAANVSKFEEAAKTKQKVAASISPFQVEVYTPEISGDKNRELVTFLSTFDPTLDGALINPFVSRATEKWKRYDKKGASSQAHGPLFERVEIIHDRPAQIIVVQPIKGDLSLFFKVIEFLHMNDLFNDDEKLKPDTALVFMSPFFNYEDAVFENQKKLLYSILHIQNENPDSIYVLQEKAVLAGDFANKIVREFLHDLIFLYPTHLLFPAQAGQFEGLLLSASKSISEMKKTNAATFKPISDILKDEKIGGVAINADIKTDSTFANYLNVFSESVNTIGEATTPFLQCKTLKNLVYNTDLTNPIQLVSNILVFRFVNKQSPLICSTADGAVLGTLPPEDKFKGSEKLKEFVKAPLIEVNTNGRLFLFRDATDKVKQNWKDGLFSDYEADFLNSLKLTPYVMTSLFQNDRSWKELVADFFESLVKSKCFNDISVLTVGECQSTRDFLNNIYEHFIEQSQLSETVEDDKPFPVRTDFGDLEIEWPEELVKKEPQIIDFNALFYNDDDNYVRDVLVIHYNTKKYQYMKLTKQESEVENQPSDTMKRLIGEIEKRHPEFVFIP